ncbi:sugar nucleotide-binding protein [Methanocalculus sp.]|uniref:SDR family oxidoreductase n=1 Tax=Methanocalculus sp. TaxID=2004547 RepID=UPI002631C5A4|nr:sugar nucleotide-binding protein [Methanocalculus sp.]MDG6249888.1 sugar nucleotide-binding protein [Methanocalculus sp.]
MGEEKTILITGANGLVGHRACEYLRKITPWKIIGTSRREGAHVDLIANLTDISDVDRIRTTIHPDIIIHTAAISRTDVCEQEQKLCYDTNVTATANLCKVFPEAKFIFFSTYAVYDTPEGRCDEECETRASNYYIQTKLDAEEHVQKMAEYVIVRPSVIFGYVEHLQDSKNYFMQLLANIRMKKVMQSPKDQYFNPIHVDIIVESLKRIIEREVCGTFNVGSNESISKFEFNRQILEKFGFDSEYLEGIDSKHLTVKRPAIGTISSAKIQRELLYEIPPLEKMIDTLYLTSSEEVKRYLADSR